MFDYDVIVIGSGPGGSAAAISCAQGGLRVALIERDRFPRDHAGETLHPGVEPLLEQLGVYQAILDAGFLRHAGQWVQWGGERAFTPFGQDEHGVWRGFQAWRADFDAILLERVRRLGVTILQPCRALHPLMSGDSIAGVITSHGTLSAPFVVDAAGSRHWLARQLRLSMERRSRPLIAFYGYAEGDCATHDEAPAIVAAEDGWLWTARIRPHLFQWTRLSTQRSEFSSDRQWLPEAFRGLHPQGRTRGADVTWRIVDASAGAGYFMVGDAAAVLDPASSHGVLKAMMTGMMTGHLLKLLLNQEVGVQHAVEHYRRWVSRWFTHDSQRLREFYATLHLEVSRHRGHGPAKPGLAHA